MALFLCSKVLRNYKLTSNLKLSNIRNINQVFTTGQREHKQIKQGYFQSNRSFYNSFFKTTTSQQKIADDVPDEYVLIYKSTLNKYITVAQIFSSISAILIFFQVIYKNDSKGSNEMFGGKKNVYTRKSQVENEKLVYNVTFVLLLTALYLTISRLPQRIYYLQQQQKYIFISNGFIPFTIKKLICKVGDVKPSPSQAMGFVPWGEHRYSILGKKVYLMEENFRKPADLNIMLGLQSDKPLEK